MQKSNYKCNSTKDNETLIYLVNQNGIDIGLIEKIVSVCNTSMNERQLNKKIDNIIKDYLENKEMC